MWKPYFYNLWEECYDGIDLVILGFRFQFGEISIVIFNFAIGMKYDN